MPFLITVISLLLVTFMVFFFLQTNEVQSALSKPPVIQESLSINNNSLNEKKWKDLYTLEKFAMSNRYYHARLIIRSRILIISFSFLTGITIAIIGAIFILSKYSEAASHLSAGAENFNVKIISSSPGVILAFMGIVLIAISIFSKTDLNVVDSPLYLENIPTDTVSITPINNAGLAKRHALDSLKKRRLDSALIILKKR